MVRSVISAGWRAVLLEQCQVMLLRCSCRFAFGWVLLLTIMLVLGTKESAMFNLVVTIIHIVLVLFIIIVSTAFAAQ